MPEYARFILRDATNLAAPDAACAWLDIPHDVALLNEFWRACGAAAMPVDEWKQIARDGYRYAAVIRDAKIVS
ncbi:MAG: hypothetical protein ABGY41_02745, partial [Candidatus Poribacteria bacterium]